MYTDLIVSRRVALAAGETTTPAATAALEIASSMWARAFASADVAPAHPAVTPFTLSQIGRALCRRGEYVAYLDVTGGRSTLIEAHDWDVEGRVDPAGWRYRLTLGGPSGAESVTVPRSGVVHIQYSADPSEPWRGISPLGWASLTGELSARVEQALSDEARFASAQLVPMPEGQQADDDEANKVRALRGRLLLVETTAGGHGDRAGAPRGDWQQQRLGMNPPAGEIELRSEVQTAILMACGIPPSLVTVPADGSGQRESYRRFLHATIAPVAKIAAQGLSEALDSTISLSFGELAAADTAGRTRALKQLREAGVELGEARKLTGLS